MHINQLPNILILSLLILASLFGSGCSHAQLASDNFMQPDSLKKITNIGSVYGSWSPDGSKIAFTSHRDGNNEIYVMDTDGSNQINITNNSASDMRPSWSPF